MSELSVTYDLYVDVLFLINFLMDFFMLSVTARVFHYGSPLRRRGLAAAAGALWAVAAAAWPSAPPWILLPVTYAAVPAGLVFWSFRPGKLRELLREMAALYLVTVMAAGIMEGLYRHTGAGWYFEQLIRGNEQAAIPFVILILLGTGTYFGLRGGIAWALEYQKGRNHFYEVTMHYRGKEKTVTALLDTGNNLYEPISHRPVHVVTYEAVRGICEEVSRVVYIPFGSVGKKQGLLPGIFLDQMEIRQGSSVKIIEKPLVAVLKQPLSEDGRYQMLLHEV